MRRTIVRIGATGAGALLALGLFAGPSAGAAGSDKGSDKQNKAEQSEKVTCFNDEGHTQGRSLSDPDGTSNGGADKPGCDRVPPWNADTDNDGNNGCGNDADREDDNNGNCGRQPAQGPSNPGGEESQEDGGDDTGAQAENAGSDPQLQTAGSATALQTAEAPTTVMGAGLTAPATETTASTTTPDTQVLGETLSAPDTLARTGAGIGGLALLGGLLLGGGRLSVLARRFLRID